MITPLFPEEKFRPFKVRYKPDADTFFINTPELPEAVREANRKKGLCYCGQDHSHPYTQKWDIGGYSECPLNDRDWDGTVDCLKVDKRARKHPLYNTWKMMWRRCYDKTDENYQWYGARGIQIYADWVDFDAYIADVGEKPDFGYESDRINNDLGYHPNNCRWVTRTENMENTRTSKVWHIKGREYPSASKAAYAENTTNSHIYSMCYGFTNTDGEVFPPRPDCYSRLKYAKPDGSFDDSRDRLEIPQT